MRCPMCGVLGVEVVDFPREPVQVEFFGITFTWRVCRECVVELRLGPGRRTAFTKA